MSACIELNSEVWRNCELFLQYATGNITGREISVLLDLFAFPDARHLEHPDRQREVVFIADYLVFRRVVDEWTKR